MSQMLKKFQVTNYRNFNGTFALDLRTRHDYQFNKRCIKNGLVNNGIIYAKNARGKSNLGRAIMDIRNNFTRVDQLSRGVDTTEDPGFINADATCREASFDYVFDFEGQEIAYSYSKDIEQHLTRETLRVGERVVYDFDHKSHKMNEENLSIAGIDEPNWEFGDSELSLLSYFTNSVPAERSALLFSLRRYISGMMLLSGGRDPWYAKMASRQIIRSNAVPRFEAFLRRYGVDETLEVKQEVDGRQELFFNHVHGQLPFAKYASSGTAALAQFFSAYELGNNYSFVYLDEFDAFYHFELAEKIVRHLSESDCQTIATSHNTALLSNSIMRPDCFYILSRERILSLADATDRELREGHNLEKLYKSGEFDESDA